MIVGVTLLPGTAATFAAGAGVAIATGAGAALGGASCLRGARSGSAGIFSFAGGAARVTVAGGNGACAISSSGVPAKVSGMPSAGA